MISSIIMLCMRPWPFWLQILHLGQWLQGPNVACFPCHGRSWECFGEYPCRACATHHFHGRYSQNGLAFDPSKNAPLGEQTLAYKTCVNIPPSHKHCLRKRDAFFMEHRAHTSPSSPSSSTSISSRTSAHTWGAHGAKGHKEGTKLGAEYKIGVGATRYEYPQIKGPITLSLKE